MTPFNQNDPNDWLTKANELMRQLIKTKPQGFSADDLHALFVSEKFPKNLIKKFSGKLFREFQAQNLIEKQSEFTLSVRHSAPLPIWTAAQVKE